MYLIDSYIYENFLFQFTSLFDSSSQGNSVAFDSSGNMYVAGWYTKTGIIENQTGAFAANLPSVYGQAAFFSKFDSQGNYLYSRIVNNITGTDSGQDIAVDGSGNVYLAGYYTTTAPTIKDQAGTSLGTLPVSAGGSAAFVCKFDSSGTYQYARTVDGTGNDQGLGVACDSSGNMYLTGFYTTGAPTIEDQAGTSLGTLPAATGQAAFVCKFNSSGTYQYSRTIDGTGDDQGLSVACDSSGNLYLAGYYIGTSTIKDQAGTSLGTLPASVSGTRAAYVCKFNSTGTYQYARLVDTGAADQGSSVTCDSSGNMYLGGRCSANATIRDQAGTTLGTLPTTTGFAAYACKFDSSGTYQYARLVDGATGNDFGYSVACDSSGNMYLVGYYIGTSTITIIDQAGTSLGTLPASAGSGVAFLCKFNSAGTYQHARLVDGTGDDQGYSVACDSNRNVCMTGQIGANSQPLIKDQAGTTLAYLPVLQNASAYAIKFDSSGNYAPKTANVTSNTFSSFVGLQVSDSTCDSVGNIYIVGWYDSTTQNIKDSYGRTLGGSLPAASGQAAFLCKFDSSGTYQYSRILDGSGTENGWGVACDSSGNVYLCGYYTGTPTIKDQAGTSLGTLPTSAGSNSTFLIKFDSVGTYQYSRIVDGTGNDASYSIACDSFSAVYFSGSYQTGTPTIKDQAGTSLGTLPAPTSDAAFVCKFNSAGTYQYTRIVDASLDDRSLGVAVDSSSNMYLCGYYSGTSPTLRNQAGTSLGTLPASAGSYAAFVCKFDSSGTYQYSRIVDGSGDDRAFSVACDSSANMYLTGFYSGTPTIKDQTGTSLGTLPASAGGSVAFACKFNSTGTYQYSRIVDGTGAEQGFSVECDSSGNMYLAGYYSTAATIKDQAGTSLGTLPTASGQAAFVCKFNSSGTYQYSRIVDGSGSEQGLGVACDSSGNMYLSGFCGASASIIDQNSSVLGYFPAQTTTQNGFVIKFDSNGNYAPIQRTSTATFSRIVDGTSLDEGLGVACDSSGNMYFAGYYLGTPTIKDQAGTSLGTLPTASGVTIGAFVCKFNSFGTYQYSRIVDGTGSEYGRSVACDSSGNMYLTGLYSGTPTVKDQANTALGTLPASVGGDTAYVCKFDSSGTYQYARIVDSTGNDQGYGVACDSSSNVYLAGYCGGSPTIKDQAGTSLGTLPSAGAFFCKFNATGTYLYARIVDSGQGRGVACDSSSNVYLTGYYQGTSTIMDQAGTSLGTLPTSSQAAAFVCKFNAAGTYQYSRIVDELNNTNDFGNAVACDSSGNLYLAGNYQSTPTIKDQNGTSLGTLPASTGQAAAFVCKFDSSGTYQYARIVDSTGNDWGLGVACDSSGNMYLAGYYNGTPTIKDQNGTSLGTLPTASGQAAFVCKFNSTGTYQYSRIIDGATNNEQGYGVACDSYGNVYLSGYYQGTPTIKDQAGTSLGTLPVPDSGSQAAYVCKFSPDGVYSP